MNATLTPTHLNVELTPFEKVGGLRGNLRIPRERIREAHVDPAPLDSIRWKFKVGLRLPRRLFIAHTDSLRHFWAIRRGLPAVSVTLDGGRPERVTVTTPDAERIVSELRRS